MREGAKRGEKEMEVQKTAWFIHLYTHNTCTIGKCSAIFSLKKNYLTNVNTIITAI